MHSLQVLTSKMCRCVQFFFFLQTMKNVTVLKINAVTCKGVTVPSNLFVGPTSNLLHEENKFRIIS